MAHGLKSMASTSMPASYSQQSPSAGAILAKAVGRIAGEKYQNLKDSMQNRIDQTFPGRSGYGDP